MAMNKKEQAILEALLTASALRSTSEVKPDIPAPQNGETSGWVAVAASSDSARVEPAWSKPSSHGTGRFNSYDGYGSQCSIPLYSTKLLALRSLRYQVELDCAKRLRRIDRMIEDENAKE